MFGARSWRRTPHCSLPSKISARAKIQDLSRLLVAAAQGMALISRTQEDGTHARSVARAALASLTAPA